MMKPTLVSLMVFLTSIAIAQDDFEEVGLGSGDLLVEITTSPFNRDVAAEASSSTTLLSFGQFRARYFVNETIAPRLGFSFSSDDNKSGISTPDVTESTFEYSISAGAEYHFWNEDGFTSYAFLDGLVSSRSVERLSTTDLDISGALPGSSADVSAIISDPNESFDFYDRGFFSFGAQLGVGAEYHFGSRFYLGTEIGFYFNTGTTSDVEIGGQLYQEGIGFSEAGVNTSNSFRIGFMLL